MKSNSLEINGLVIARDGVPLSAPITVRVEPGELLLVRGANGSGKSTLLKILAGLLPITEGQVLLDDAEPTPGRALYLGHKRGLIPSMTVLHNVAFWARASGYPELAAAAMHYFDLDDIPHVQVATLSAGWQQRVALTRIVTIPMKWWLLDEPMANLDAEGIALLQSLVQSRLEQAGGVIMTTHTEIQGSMIKTLNLSMLSNSFKVAA